MNAQGNMDDILSEATKKGMYLVDHDNTGPLFEEYEDAMMEADQLCEVNDPVTAPFESKYKARTLLDQIINKLDATRAISTLEKKTATIEQLDRRLASAKVKVGTISWECEEPHNAQTDLELACQFYFPGLVDKITEMSGEGDEEHEGGKEKTVTSADIKEPPVVPVLAEILVVDAMRALNILGILWAGRGQVQKSMLFLLCARQFYLTNIDAATAAAPVGQKSKFSKKVLTDLGYTYTHNLFYLAQAYGNIGDTKKSCEFCHMTLQRQYSEGFKDIRASLDWVKNCCGISDFYLAMRQFNNCALALASAESVLKKYAIPRILAANPEESSSIKKLDSGNNNFVSGNINAAEIEADLSRRWAMLDVRVLRRSFERAKNYESALSLGIKLEEIEAEMAAEDGPAEAEDFNMAEFLAHKAAVAVPESTPAADPSAAVEGTVFQKAEATAQGPTGQEVEFFTGIPVKPTSSLQGGDIKSFEDARVIFLRATARIEFAKKYYVLDGYVTDHVTMTQEQSKLYHYLSVFEADPKRKLAMEARRFDLLAPMLKALNRASFEVLHKQISYELGEGSLTMLDIKLDKFRERDPRGEVNVAALKKVEITKCNEYCKTGLVNFAHFTYLYAPSKTNDAKHAVAFLEELPLYDLVVCGCTEPDESTISEEEVRPFLNAHFLSCRIMSKVIVTPAYLPPGSGPAQRAHYLVACLRRYEWLQKFAVKICALRNVTIAEVFGEEHKICEEMVRLLPSKIDRMCFLGESGLSL